APRRIFTAEPPQTPRDFPGGKFPRASSMYRSPPSRLWWCIALSKQATGDRPRILKPGNIRRAVPIRGAFSSGKMILGVCGALAVESFSAPWRLSSLMRIAFLHGFAGDVHAWDEVIEAWRVMRPVAGPDGRRILFGACADELVTVTLPGHGVPACADWAATLAAVADAIGEVDLAIG